jgi:hypothetical protein
MNCEEFLNSVFELKDDRAHILLWELGTKKSSWFKNPRAAAAYAEGRKNIYVGVGLSNTNRGHHKRYEISQVDGVPGFAVDIDVQHKHAHKKANLPKSTEEARSLIEGHGFDPTLIIHSGHGIQAWWLFKEPEMFDNNGQREEIQTLSRRLHNTVMERAIENKLTIDNVSDISRILRPVGTINHKPNCKPVDVVALRTDGPRYNPDDFEEMLIDYEPQSGTIGTKKGTLDQTTLPDQQVKSTKKVKQKIVSITEEIKEKAKMLVINPDAVPPQEKFAELSGVRAPVFWYTWEKQRNDGDHKINDTSPSGYDMTLANYAAEVGWEDQEILDLMIACRRKHGDDLHVKNLQKYTRTIINAQAKAKKTKIDKDVQVQFEYSGTEYQDIEKIRNTVMKRLSIQGLAVVEFTLQKFKETPIIYRLTINGDHVDFNDENFLFQRAKFRQLFYKLTSKNIRFEQKKWDAFSDLILALTEDVLPNELRTARGLVRNMLNKYLGTRTICGVQDGAKEKQAFIHKGHWYILIDDFFTWATLSCGNKMSSQEFYRIVEVDLEIEKKAVSYNKEDGRRTSYQSGHKIPAKAIFDSQKIKNFNSKTGYVNSKNELTCSDGNVVKLEEYQGVSQGGASMV